MPATTPQSRSDRRMMASTARGQGQGVRSIACNLRDWTRSACDPMTFWSAEVPTTFLAIDTHYPRSLKRYYRLSGAVRHSFLVPARGGKQQVEREVRRSEMCEDDVGSALQWKGLPRCAA